MDMIELRSDMHIIADTHFGHANISTHEPIRKVKAYENGFSNVDDLMVSNWNQIVKPDDTVIHLGDLAFKYPNLSELAGTLNGKKILLVGNHDKAKDIETLRECGWQIIDEAVIAIDEKKKAASVLQRLERGFKLSEKEKRLLCCFVGDIDGRRIMLSHFPVFDDNPYDAKYKPITKALDYLYTELMCDLNIHGHTHSHGAKEPFCISACVELTDFKPRMLRYFLNHGNLAS